MNIFDRVKENLNRGWCRGKRWNQDKTKCCLLGAFDGSYDKGDNVAENYLSVLEEISKCIVSSGFEDRLKDYDKYNHCTPADYDDVGKCAGFNNHCDTTFKDILVVLNCAEKNTSDKDKEIINVHY